MGKKISDLPAKTLFSPSDLFTLVDSEDTNPQTQNKSATWDSIGKEMRRGVYYVDSLDGIDTNSGRALDDAFKTLDKALVTVRTYHNDGGGAIVYLANDRTDYTLTGIYPLQFVNLVVLGRSPPSPRVPGTAKITQAATADGSGNMPCIQLTSATAVFNQLEIATAETIPVGATGYQKGFIYSQGALCGVQVYSVKLRIGATPFIESLAAMIAVDLTILEVLRATGATGAAILDLESIGAASISIESVTRTNGGIWSSYIIGTPMHAATAIPMNLLSNVALTA